MPTAPRSPTQEMNSFSRQEKRNGARHRNTATGRATSISVSRHRQRRQQPLRQPVRPDQQAEQHEHHDLREPGHGIEEHHDRVVGARRPVADHEAGEIDGEKARAVHRGKPEDHQRAGGHERRVQALRQAEPVEHQHDRAPAQDAEEGAEDRLLGQHRRDLVPRLAAIAD